MADFIASLQTTLGTHLPIVLAAVAIAVVGWLVAVIARAVTRRLLNLLKVNARIEESTGQAVGVESGVASGVFWFILLIVAVTVIDALGLERISGPFAEVLAQVLGYLPKLAAGTVLLVVAWLVAMLVRVVVTKVLSATRLDDRLAAQAEMEPMSRNLGNVLFWLVILLFLPAVLAAFALEGLLEPVRAMLTKLLDIVPNVFAAAIIGGVGWLVAKILRGLVSNLMLAAGADEFGKKTGMAEGSSLSRLTGTIVFILVIVPTLIAALEALRIEAISRPATQMLQRFLDSVPSIIAAALILAITWYVARFVAGLLTRLLSGIGADALPEKLGLAGLFSGSLTPSVLAGTLLVFFAMLFAVVEAASQLGFVGMRDMVASFVHFGADVLLGGVILMIGFWLANLAHATILRASSDEATGVAGLARIAILGLVIAMGLRAMGIADEIVSLAFGLTLGAVAVAVALSFGLGGREAAGKQMEYWLSKLRKD